MSDPSEQLRSLLRQELRRAVTARIEGGADSGEVSADLEQRLQQLRRMQRESRPPKQLAPMVRTQAVSHLDDRVGE